MYMKTKDVIDYLDHRFRPELQEEYDNAGFILGDDSMEYKGAIIALDLTDEVIDEAIEYGLNLIVTHHPFIFNGIKRLTSHHAVGRMVHRLIQNNIAVYAAHTNLDNLNWGVNGALSQQIGLQNCRILKPVPNDNTIGAGMIGELPYPISVESFLLHLKDILHIPTLRTSEYKPDMAIQRVAICGGSGAFLIGDAIQAHADIYITADLKYHDFQRSEGNIVLCDAGHYESEQYAKDVIFSVISEKFSKFAVRISQRQHSIVRYI